jgi:serine/threonine protein kinase
MCVAYKAEDSQSHTLAALKFLLPERLANPKDVLRFEREAKTASHLNHPSIARVSDFGTLPNRQPFLVMEFVEGCTLAERIQSEGQLPIKETIGIFIKICDALQYAHSKNVLHRDIKPSNIIVNDSPEAGLSVKLLDFGIAKSLQNQEPASQKLTETGEVVGTPFYMSPEQARGGELDCRSDLYSLGCTLYEALTGTPPHLGQTPLATILKRETDKPTTMAEASMGRAFPEELEQIVFKLLQTDPKDRFQNASEVRDALAETKLTNPQTFSITSKRGIEKKVRQTTSYSIRTLVAIVGIGAIATVIFWFVGVNYSELIKLVTPQKRPEAPPLQIEIPEVKSLFAREWLTKAEEYEHTGQYSKACNCYQEAIKIYSKNSDSKSGEAIVGALIKQASCFRILGDYANATQAIQRALALSRALYGEHTALYAAALTSMGTNSLLEKPKHATSTWRQVEPLFARSISICEENPRLFTNDVIELLKAQGDVCFLVNLFDEARQRYEKALALSHNHRVENISLPPVVICSLGKIYRHEGNFAQEKRLYKQLLEIFATSSFPQQCQNAEYIVDFADELEGLKYKTKDTLDLVGLQQNLYLKAFSLYTEIYALGEPSNGKLGKLAYAIALTFHVQGDYGVPDAYRQAESWYRRARAGFEKQANPEATRLAEVNLSIANMLRAQKRYEEAEELVEKVLPEFKKLEGEKSPKYVNALYSLAEIKFDQKQYLQAEPLFIQGLQAYEATGQSHSLAEAHGLYRLACCKYERGKYSEAVRLLTAAQPIYQKLRANSPQSPALEQEIKATRAMLKAQH